jgi:Ca2+/Na+ antiporter
MNIYNLFSEKEPFLYRLSTLFIIGFIYYTIFNNTFIQDIRLEQTIFYIVVVFSISFLILYFHNNKNYIVAWLFLVIPVFLYLIYQRYQNYLKNKEEQLKVKYMKEFKETYMNDNVHVNEPRPEFASMNNQGLPNPAEMIPRRYPEQANHIPMMNQPPVNGNFSQQGLGLDFSSFNASNNYTPYDGNFKY